MKIYARGRAFEYRVRNAFQAQGWIVIRSAGSHTPADLVACSLTETVFVQCKASFEPHISKKERVFLERAQGEFYIWCVIACKARGGGIAFYGLDYKEVKAPWHQ